MANQWFYKRGEEKFGPVSADQLKSLASSNQILTGDLIWKEGMAEWVRADRLKGLFADTRSSTPAAVNVQPAQSTARPDVNEGPVGATPNSPRATSVNPFTNVLGSSTANQINATLSSAKRYGAGFVGRFQQIDFKREVWPLNSGTASKLFKEPAFWAITLLAGLPLLFITLSGMQYQLVAFAVYFAAIWGLIFRYNLVPNVKVGWGLLACVFFFTGIIAIPLLLLLYQVLPTWYTQSSDSSSAAFRLFGFVFQVGICEELCKILPVAAIMIFLRKRLTYGDIVMLGIFSALGFSAFENLKYSYEGILGVVSKAMEAAPTFTSGDQDSTSAGIRMVARASSEAVITALLRSISSTFGHAVYSGIFAHFLALARGARTKKIPFWIVGLGLAAAFHGLYDWTIGIQQTMPVVVTVVAFMLLKLYVVQGTEVSSELDSLELDDQPTAASEPQLGVA